MAYLFNNFTFSHFSSVHVMNKSHFKVNWTATRMESFIIYLSFTRFGVYASSMESHSSSLTDNIERCVLTSSPSINSIGKSSTSSISNVTGSTVSISTRLGKVVTWIKRHFPLTTIDSCVVFTTSSNGVIDRRIRTLPQVLSPPVFLRVGPTVIVLCTAGGVGEPLGGSRSTGRPPGGFAEG